MSRHVKVIRVARSLLANYVKYWQSVMTGGGGSVKDVNGNDVAVKFVDSVSQYGDCNAGSEYWVMRANAPAGDDSYGLVVGSGTKAVEMGDYNLEAKIPHGTASGQVEYSETIVEGTTTYDNKAQRKIKRTFTNSGPDPVTISEFGLVVYHYYRVWDNGGSRRQGPVRFMILRELIDPPVTLNPGDMLTIELILEITT